MVRIGRLFPLFLAGLGVALPAGAQARAVCEDLRHELSMSVDTIVSTRQSRRFTNTINQLNRDIRQLRSDLRRAGCSNGSVIYYGSGNNEYCLMTEDDLHQAETAKREMLQRRMDLDADMRGEILAAMRRNGCSETELRQPDPVAPQPEDIIASRGDDNRSDGYGMRDFGAIDRQPDDMLLMDGQPLDIAPVQGNLRTLCVRTCDGGFFPISSNATPASFASDAATCARMCPGTQTELYYHSMPDQETSDMVSASTGAPYTALPTAFAYRNGKSAKDSSCSCNLKAYYQDVLRKEKGILPDAKPEKEKSITRLPAERETAAKPATPEEGSSAKVILEERAYDPSNSNVRQVGPRFLSDGSAGIDLKNPKGSLFQPRQ